MDVVVFARFRVMPEGQAEGSAAGHPSAPPCGGMVIYDRDRTGSIKRATTPPVDGGQTQKRPASGHVRADSRRLAAKARMCPSRRP